MASLNLSHTFTAGTEAKASEVNQNFTDVKTFVNTNVVHKDGTNPFTVMPVLPSGDANAVATNAHAANKAYVDATAASTALASQPTNVAWGRVGSATRTADTQQSFVTTTYGDITDLTVTFTGVAGRRYKATAVLVARNDLTTAGSFSADMVLTTGANTQLARSLEGLSFENDTGTLTICYLGTATGSTTWKLRGRVNSGSGWWTTVCSATAPGVLLVEDIGPV
jgi:hypothetical protein